MKNTPVSSLRLSLMGLMLLAHPVWAQGPLAPMAGPQPMMKTLQEMEPRTHITAPGYVISAPGSYYLTANLNGGGSQNGITVNASGVTIDLRGFSIENCLIGISAASGIRNVAVANGIVRDCANTGVDLSGAAQCRLEGVMLAANGVDGVRAGAGSLITLCTASGNGGLGMILGDNGTVFRCVVQNNANGGITIGSNCQASENTITGNGSTTGQAGLVTIGSNNRIEANSANYNNGQGFLINGSGNLVIRNNACNNTIADYQLASGNHYGQILVAPGAGFTSSNAWANFGCNGCQSAAECDDANPCTENACVANACVSTPVPGCGPCQTASECDDGNPCTEDICEAEFCVHAPIPGCGAPICGNNIIENGEACDDGNMINGDGCSNACQTEGGGGCQTAMDCNDGNPCTMDACNNGNCQYSISPNGTPCDDGNYCNGAEVCIAGACTAGTPINCDDGDPCTIDSCDSMMGGCTHTLITNCGQACTDGSTQSCYTGPIGTANVGVCQSGVQTCSDGTWGACVGQVLPTAEICDSMDNDCDGLIDEDLNLGWTCSTGLPGICGSGTLVCGGGQVVCVPNLTPGSQTEICDGIDNDCDGTVDEGGVCNAVCGDGVVAGGETCDDQNQTNGDGCSAACTVEAGYSCAGSPSVCVDINECVTNNGGCSPNAACTNTVGSYTCACIPGYVGDGITCSQVLATCADGIKNGAETGVDCGGGTCAPCANGQGCTMASDCASGVCSGAFCVAN